MAVLPYVSSAVTATVTDTPVLALVGADIESVLAELAPTVITEEAPVIEEVEASDAVMVCEPAV